MTEEVSEKMTLEEKFGDYESTDEGIYAPASIKEQKPPLTALDFAHAVAAFVVREIRKELVAQQGTSGNQGLRMGYALAIDDFDSEAKALGVPVEE